MAWRTTVLIAVVLGVGIFLAGAGLVISFLPESMTSPNAATLRLKRARAERRAAVLGERVPVASADAPEAPDFRPTLTVRVRHPSGEPAGGATLLLDGEPVGVSEADGRLSLPIDVSLPHRLQAEWGDLASAATPLDERSQPRVEPGEPWTEELYLWPRGRLRGRVIDAGQRPAAEVPVWITPRLEGLETVSAADGSFTFEGLPVGEVEVMARRDEGSAAATRAAIPPAPEGAPVEASVLLVLEPRPRTEVRVRDAGGEPIAGARVMLRGGWRVDEDHHTDAEGVCWLSGASRSGELTVRHAGHGSFEGRWEPLPPLLEITLERAGELVVSARFEDGSPIPGGRVSLQPEVPGAPLRSVALDAEGAARIDDLAPGVVELRLTAPGLAAGEPRRVEIVSGERSVVELIRARPTGRLEGVALASDDRRPVAGAEVTVHGQTLRGETGVESNEFAEVRAITDEEGRFVFTALPPGPAIASVTAFGYGSGFSSLSVPSDGVEIELETLCVIEGRLVSTAGLPLGGVELVEGTLEKRADGRFRAELLFERREVRFQGPGHATLTRSLEGGCPGPVELGEVRLGPGPEVTVEVVDPEGEGVEGALVIAGGWHTTDAAGEVRIRPGEGSRCVWAEHPGYVASSQDDCPAIGPETDRIRLTLQAGGVIEGRAFGRPHAILQLERFGEASVWGSARSTVPADAWGRYRSQVLPPGRYQAFVTADRPGEKMLGVSRVGELRAGETLELDVGTPADARIEGGVLTDPGQRSFIVLVVGAQLANTAREEGWEGLVRFFESGVEATRPYLRGARLVEVDLAGGEGRYALEGLAPGPALLLAGPTHLEGGLPYLQLISLDAGERRTIDLVY
ncbi:MAG: carboxypeptidase-like regulatory domain-containing protein [Deltaproteobacteria bacterium]|nr:carboxypeptidase-like regulatory domain-containing protein [Deltaproteobacteria bacterium]